MGRSPPGRLLVPPNNHHLRPSTSPFLFHNHRHHSHSAFPAPLATPERHVYMPIDFYRVLGAETHFLGDGIRRAYEGRVSKPSQCGYSQEALISRRQILQAACETLANPRFRREYNESLAQDEFDTILTQVLWEKEAGETEMVLQIGESLLRKRLPKSFKQDVVLAMALAYVDISRDAMALSPRGFIRGCEVLERALKLLQIDLFAATPSNIPVESFEVYGVALALVARAFVRKRPHLIEDAVNLFQQLQQTKVTALSNSVSVYTARENREIDFALERVVCSLLVGEVDECCSWLGLECENSPHRDPSIVTFVVENSRDDKDNDLLPGLCKLLETWLMEVVCPRFRETKDVKFKLGDYYDDRMVLRYLESWKELMVHHWLQQRP